jgi:hypothetical protein
MSRSAHGSTSPLPVPAEAGVALGTKRVCVRDPGESIRASMQTRMAVGQSAIFRSVKTSSCTLRKMLVVPTPSVATYLTVSGQKICRRGSSIILRVVRDTTAPWSGHTARALPCGPEMIAPGLVAPRHELLARCVRLALDCRRWREGPIPEMICPRSSAQNSGFHRRLNRY